MIIFGIYMTNALKQIQTSLACVVALWFVVCATYAIAYESQTWYVVADDKKKFQKNVKIIQI